MCDMESCANQRQIILSIRSADLLVLTTKLPPSLVYGSLCGKDEINVRQKADHGIY